MTNENNLEPDPWIKGATALIQDAVPTPARVPPLRSTYVRHRGARLAVAGFCVVAACAAVVAVWQRGEAAVTYEVVSGIRVPAAEPTIVGGGESALLRFSDGTTAALEPGAQGRVRDLHAYGARVAIDKGRADFDVVHRERTSWLVEAGPYTVRVTGTRFRVAWDPATTVFDLQMRAGAVEVVGPYIKGAVVLMAGQSLRVRASDGEQNAAMANQNASAPQALEPEPRPKASPPRAEPRRATSSLASLTAEGKYADVVSRVDGAGLANLLQHAPATELVALAEAARYTARLPLANKALHTIRARWPRTTVAADAAFVLGTLAEDVAHDRATAQRWYQSYLREQPKGRYASETMGRSLVLTQQFAGDAAAQAQAQQYLQRFPTGTYAGVARKILSTP
ncbi:MAG: FecR family protein [Deltaproteobacteria bacterium]|nr:FecR family protein [Deltaproteobacteria bacterium]